ncbi:hypothetical protein SNE26_17435 [Mucilaginibacter sp. cycad4]|uniref:hypothetical protein n=1 Tax=Mucilaginibacter sp. cycad4 TaxID=3342096 RepID=UPI002AABD3B8|nr:hypothetical protein [Mucilaginibacter gossypii]WPU97813.1 hypothetical protein SNE26_17435 [Mucilaginibacter gossypii]
MNTSFFYQTFLTIHLSALAVMAGSTLINYLGFQTLWKLLPQDAIRAEGVLLFLSRFGRVIGIGAAVLIISGLGMMVLTKGVYGEQLWFRIKFAIVVFIVANVFVYRRRIAFKLQRLVDIDRAVLTGDLSYYRTQTRNFHILHFILFFVIITISVFKFN